MSESARDLLILDVPDTARAAHARLLGTAEAARYGFAAIDVVVGAPSWASESGLLLASAGAARFAELVRRRGLDVAPVEDGFAAVSDGLVLGVAAERAALPLPEGEITGVDHVVLTSPNRDRILATLCGRFDFDLRLDRVQPWGVHQLFLRRDDLLVEVVLTDRDEGQDDSSPVDSAPGGDEAAGRDAPDALWGIAWRTTDIEATVRRLEGAHVTVSQVRQGAKPGTRVATVKDPELGVPTILLEQSPK